MNFENFLQPLRDESRALAERCRSLQSQPALAQVALRLSQIASSPAVVSERPVIAALVGGTGVGKSQLFNALIGRPGASPTSDAERLKTKHPIIARRPAEHALLPDFGGAEVEFIDAGTPWLALADTPDLDGMDQRHRTIAEHVIAIADIVVFVTNPEKRANFALLEAVRAWAGRKRWFFVMNQIDMGEADLAAIREDFDRRLVELGFAPDDASRFLISALAPQRFDFARLRETLLRERPREAAAALAVDAVLGQALHACEPQVVTRVAELQAEIDRRAREQSAELIRRVQEAMERRQLASRLRPLLRKQVWAALPSRTGGLLALPVLVHARITGIASAFQLWRMTTGGFTVWRLGLLAATLVSAMRGSVEVRSVVARLDEDLAPMLDDMAAETNRFLEDRRLTAPAASSEATPELQQDLRQLAAEVPVAGAALARVVGLLTQGASQGRVARELAPLISEAIERRAEDAASKCVGPFTWFLNILPVAALGHIGYEIMLTWIDRQWLPAIFYLQAIAIFLLTLLPGYVLICLNVSRRLRGAQTATSILSAVDRLPPCGPAQALALLSADLAAVLAGLRALRLRAQSLRSAIDAEFGVAEVGIRPTLEPAAPPRALPPTAAE